MSTGQSGQTEGGRRRTLRALVPASVRGRARAALSDPALSERIDRLDSRLDRLETMLHESRDEGWERSRTRWRNARPDAQLTWGADLTGDAFINAARAHGAFGPGKAILEVGPGYGRLLRAARELGAEFASWTGIDLSGENVAHLEATFSDDPAIRFRQADVESVELGERVDTVLSSLTFKHLFPSFAAGLENLGRQLAGGGLVIFDLIEGARRYFEDDGVTYIRNYTRDEVEELAHGAGVEVVAFDEVHHHPDMARLLVVARRSE